MIRWLFGSRVEKTLNDMPVPLLLVRPMYQRIVVPLDGSRWSESAIPRAVELARVHDAELVLLHVYQSKSGDYAGQWALAGQQQIADQSYEQMADQLIALRNRLRQEGLRARDVMMRSDNPAQVDLRFCGSGRGHQHDRDVHAWPHRVIALAGRQRGADRHQEVAQPGDARPPGPVGFPPAHTFF